VTEPTVEPITSSTTVLTTGPQGIPAGMSVIEVTGLVTMFGGMLDRMELRITGRLDRNAAGAAERWTLHDREHILQDARFLAVEKGVGDAMELLRTHLTREHDEDVRADARLAPVKGGAAWIWRNRNSVLLVVIVILGLVGFVSDTIRGLLP
jgi:hypothetical protein